MSKTTLRQFGTTFPVAAPDHAGHEAGQERGDGRALEQRDLELELQLKLARKVLIEQADALRELAKR